MRGFRDYKISLQVSRLKKCAGPYQTFRLILAWTYSEFTRWQKKKKKKKNSMNHIPNANIWLIINHYLFWLRNYPDLNKKSGSDVSQIFILAKELDRIIILVKTLPDFLIMVTAICISHVSHMISQVSFQISSGGKFGSCNCWCTFWWVLLIFFQPICVCCGNCLL